MAAGMTGRRRARRQKAPMADINVTPMVDVMLVLLIIFMVAAPLLVTGVAVDLPETSAKALPTDDKPISVTIDSAGQRSIGDEEMNDALFAERISALGQERPDARVVIRADAALPYGEVAGLLADVTGAGFNRVALVNQPQTIASTPMEASRQE